MRRSFDGLSAMVHNHMGAGPTGGHWFVFVNRRRRLLKVLAFDGDGYWIWSKRLEAGQFAAPGRSADNRVDLFPERECIRSRAVYMRVEITGRGRADTRQGYQRSTTFSVVLDIEEDGPRNTVATCG